MQIAFSRCLFFLGQSVKGFLYLRIKTLDLMELVFTIRSGTSYQLRIHMFTQLDLDFQHTALRAKFPNMVTRFDLVCDSGYKILSAIAAVERPFISLCKKFHKIPSFAQKRKLLLTNMHRMWQCSKSIKVIKNNNI